jgi:hypothetical protein
MSGSDWRSYENAYHLINEGVRLRYETGFIVLNNLFFSLGFNFWSFLITIKSLVLFSLFFLTKNLTKNFWLALGFYFAFGGYFIFIDNPLRNFIGAGIIWVSFTLFVKNKKILAFLLFPLGGFFHNSIFVVNSFILLFYVSKKIIKSRYLNFVFIFLFLLFTSKTLIFSIANFCIPMFSLPRVQQAYFTSPDANYTSGSIMTLNFLIRIFIFLFIYINRKKLIKKPNGGFLFDFAVIYILLLRLATTLPVLGRLVIVFSPFFWAAFAESFCSLKPKNRLLVVFFILFYSLASITDLITSSSKYIPYSNYLSYLFSGYEPSFSYRASYNKLFSPFAK